jgi:hypothetical protein
MPLLPIGLTLFGQLLQPTSGTAQVLIAMAGAGAVCFRTWAVLVHKPEHKLKWWTAVGSAAGIAGTILIVLVDLIVEGG